MKGMRILVALWALALTACGSGSIQSPDFTPVLKSFAVGQSDGDNNNTVGATVVTAPAGRALTFEAIGEFTVAPGNDPTGVVPTSAKWSSSDPTVASIDEGSGVAKALKAGTTTISGTKEGFTGTIAVTVTPAIIDTVAIVANADTANTPLTADTIASGSQKTYRAVATFSDGTKTDVPSNWASDNAANVTPTPVPPNPTTTKTFAVAATVAAGTTAKVTATVATDSTLTATLNITVVASSLQSLSSVTLTPASPISAGLSTQAVAIGSNSDGSTVQLSNDSINWSSSDPTIATVDSTGRVTTVAVGTVNIIAMLKPGAFPLITDPTKRTAQTPLMVTNPACTTPLRKPPATATPSTALLCVGCTVTNPDFVIDSNDTNHADLSIPVGLLTGSVSINIASGLATEFPMGTKFGFIVGRPSGDLVSAELLSEVDLATTDSSGNVVETFTNSPSGPLVVDLLGTSVIGGITDQAVVSATATKAFTGITLTYSSGVLTALGSLQVFNACGTVTLPQ